MDLIPQSISPLISHGVTSLQLLIILIILTSIVRSSFYLFIGMGEIKQNTNKTQKALIEIIIPKHKEGMLSFLYNCHDLRNTLNLIHIIQCITVSLKFLKS